ncbi:phospholipase C/P1 nuclease domain-containing protein [Lasiosphaeria miniovina]|uniref:Phospholipase C/P1 nuclease domain-containing protein n=1 Tax=Lasiosphaeria miniovina TaxID=1954250 RepID=A0AA40ATP5_9PEZI|nr:phospholipase C/P1 nuclease domain-containing protein [Lasiosphaeria miniovina]KAK0721824.1 phospholipase C/P1 nuclease domain-containing protein [Lasiosphaeria miniovina]
MHNHASPFLAAAALALAPTALAWGTVGHATVAYIATGLMKPETASYCQQVLGDTSGDFIGGIASWADSYRYEPGGGFSSAFHYIDALDNPPYTCDVDFDRDCTAEGCIVSAIMNYTNIQRAQHDAESLKFLVHFLGDIHQPLHDENYGAGGNNITVLVDGVAWKLHAAWDTAFMTKITGGTNLAAAKTFSARLLTSIRSGVYASAAKRWFRATLADSQAAAMGWANDANDLVCSHVLPQGPAAIEGAELNGTYYRDAVPVLELAMAKAGWRLAAWLDLIATGSTPLGTAAGACKHARHV